MSVGGISTTNGNITLDNVGSIGTSSKATDTIAQTDSSITKIKLEQSPNSQNDAAGKLNQQDKSNIRVGDEKKSEQLQATEVSGQKDSVKIGGHPHLNEETKICLEKLQTKKQETIDPEVHKKFYEKLINDKIIDKEGRVNYEKLGVSKSTYKGAKIECVMFINSEGAFDFNAKGVCGEKAQKCMEVLKKVLDDAKNVDGEVLAVKINIDPELVGPLLPEELVALENGGKIQYLATSDGQYVKLILDPGSNGQDGNLIIGYYNSKSVQGKEGEGKVLMKIPFNVVFEGADFEGEDGVRKPGVKPTLPDWNKQNLFEEARVQKNYEKRIVHEDRLIETNEMKAKQAENTLLRAVFEYLRITVASNVDDADKDIDISKSIDMATVDASKINDFEEFDKSKIKDDSKEKIDKDKNGFHVPPNKPLPPTPNKWVSGKIGEASERKYDFLKAKDANDIETKAQDDVPDERSTQEAQKTAGQDSANNSKKSGQGQGTGDPVNKTSPNEVEVKSTQKPKIEGMYTLNELVSDRTHPFARSKRRVYPKRNWGEALENLKKAAENLKNLAKEAQEPFVLEVGKLEKINLDKIDTSLDGIAGMADVLYDLAARCTEINVNNEKIIDGTETTPTTPLASSGLKDAGLLTATSGNEGQIGFADTKGTIQHVPWQESLSSLDEDSSRVAVLNTVKGSDDKEYGLQMMEIQRVYHAIEEVERALENSSKNLEEVSSANPALVGPFDENLITEKSTNYEVKKYLIKGSKGKVPKKPDNRKELLNAAKELAKALEKLLQSEDEENSKAVLQAPTSAVDDPNVRSQPQESPGRKLLDGSNVQKLKMFHEEKTKLDSNWVFKGDPVFKNAGDFIKAVEDFEKTSESKTTNNYWDNFEKWYAEKNGGSPVKK